MLKTIIVDDEVNIRQGLEKALDWGKYGFTVAGSAEDGVEALKIFEELKPCLVITDIKMPRMDGLELSRELKMRDPQISIIIISGYSDFSYAREAIRFGVADYLLKPVDFDELAGVLKNIYKSLSARMAPGENEAGRASCGDGRIGEVLAYIRKNYQNEITLKKLAELFFFNPVYLGQLFKTETGKYFHDIINEIRIEEVIRLLQERVMNIDEIFGRVGYKNSDHFYKSFKKVTGMNPGEYKKKHFR